MKIYVTFNITSFILEIHILIEAANQKCSMSKIYISIACIKPLMWINSFWFDLIEGNLSVLQKIGRFGYIWWGEFELHFLSQHFDFLRFELMKMNFIAHILFFSLIFVGSNLTNDKIFRSTIFDIFSVIHEFCA